MTPGPDFTPLVETTADSLRDLTSPGTRCLLAVSGGPDSLAMLDLLHLGRERHGRALSVAHVDHGIAPGSERVAAAVAGAASERGLEFAVRRLALPTATSETRARSARRTALIAMARQAGAAAIVLAHTAEDQAETVLLRVLRGSGTAGLAAMSARRGRWIRPLLALRRVQLMEHLESRGITPWFDPANRDPRHLRSWLRADVLPVVEARLPDAIGEITRVARHAAAMRRAWHQAIEALPDLGTRVEAGRISVAADVLAGYRSELRRAVVAGLGRRAGVLLGARRLQAVDQLLARDSQGRSIAVGSGRWVELAAGRLTFYRRTKGFDAVTLQPGAGTALGGARFEVRAGRAARAARGGWAADLLPGAYLARPWRPGDRIRPLGGTGSRAVAVFFREAQVPPSRRAAWPVVVSADDATVVWVPGICRSDARIPAEGAEAWHVDCAFA